ncbi:MAG: histidinol-phosphatase HisJ family protein [Planctomycetota bacterium]|jgi:histidinol-phosphatase (PHP family)
MLASYHNHTTWSDGKGSVAQLVAAARELGLGEVGISDHFTLHPTLPAVSWSMPPDQVGAYVRELRAAAEESRSDGGPEVRVGLEVDWFAATESAIREALADPALDFAIGSVHFNGDFTLDGDAATWESLSPDERDEMHRAYWRQIPPLAASGLFEIAAHLDLPKKFGFHARGDLGPLITDSLDAIAEARMVVEINTNGWHCPCREPYPSAAILSECRRREIPVTISADAHQPAHLLRDFPTAAKILREAGYDQIARFAGRQVRLEPLESAVPS